MDRWMRTRRFDTEGPGVCRAVHTDSVAEDMLERADHVPEHDE